MVKSETRRDAEILVRNPSPRLFGDKFGDSKKVILTTNNRIQAGLIQPDGRRIEKHWTQNQLTTRMHNYQKNTCLFENVQNVYSTSDWRNDPFGCSESKVIFKWWKNNKDNNKKTNKKALQTSKWSKRSHLVYLTNKHNQHGQSTHRKARLEPAIMDRQKLAQNVFPPWILVQSVYAENMVNRNKFLNSLIA